MTRINCVPVEILHAKHLVAEYRELPRVFALVAKSWERGESVGYKAPQHYVLGTGHVRFFYDKLTFLNLRHQKLVEEMIKRDFKPSYREPLSELWKEVLPDTYWNNWLPTLQDMRINLSRLVERMEYYKKYEKYFT